MEVYKAQVTTVKDILFLRTKLYDASIRMEVDPIASNKIVSETSDILKILVKEAKIGISISIQENASAYQILQLTISGALPSDYDKIQETDTIDILGLDQFTAGVPLKIQLNHADGSSDVFDVNHTYNDTQIEWFKAGSALNLIKQQNQ